MSTTTTRKWGIVTSVQGLASGICVNSLDWSETVEQATAANDKGAITDIAAYSRKRSVTVTGVQDTAKGELAKAGDKLTLDGNDFLITSVAKKESNSAFVEVTITAESADSAIITIIDDGTE